jgi:predicted ATPase
LNLRPPGPEPENSPFLKSGKIRNWKSELKLDYSKSPEYILRFMYIREFTAKNYLVHKNTTVELSPITVFVGPNGGGKSAFFDAILNFSMVARGSLRQAFAPFPYSYMATKYHGASKLARIGFDVVLSDHASDSKYLRYQIDYAQKGPSESGTPSFQIFHELLVQLPENKTLFDRTDVDSSPLTKAAKFVEEDRGIFAALRAAFLNKQPEGKYESLGETAREISRFNRFRLSPYNLAGTSRLPDLTEEGNAPRLGHTGDDLAACLYYMQEKKDPVLENVFERVREVVPGFKGFEFTFWGSDRVAFSMEFEDNRGTVSSVRLSDGLLLFLGLMVLTYSSNRPPVMLIEEPENGLTPTALKLFYKAVRELAFAKDQAARSQILISSHSPFIICEAWNGEDRDFIHQVKIENGQAVVRKFSDAVKEQQIVLGKDKDNQGKRTILGLRNAEELMSGYLS